jgi:hypothetical protein
MFTTFAVLQAKGFRLSKRNRKKTNHAVVRAPSPAPVRRKALAPSNSWIGRNHHVQHSKPGGWQDDDHYGQLHGTAGPSLVTGMAMFSGADTITANRLSSE